MLSLNKKCKKRFHLKSLNDREDSKRSCVFLFVLTRKKKERYKNVSRFDARSRSVLIVNEVFRETVRSVSPTLFPNTFSSGCRSTLLKNKLQRFGARVSRITRVELANRRVPNAE